ncbi:hypothetical protein INT43_007698 [Umbelopsis isabellina]|uniref:Aminotransferase class I/classII large domain-containing protein n=1 Tax=Mortierella isabellina TaxID=91625 RepID=A0A8H7PMY1_MORIS|nr:hypothetical protein INT43_007698 [Umbelopsis isabellina]
MTTLFDDKAADVIDLSIGAPARDLMPVDMVAAACTAALSSNDKACDSFQVSSDDMSRCIPAAIHSNASCKQYGPEAGDGQYLSELSILLQEEYCHLGLSPIASDSHLCCTSGASQSITNLLTLFSEPTYTSHVFLQSPTYHLVFQMVKDRGYKTDQLVGIPEDADGIDIAWLEGKLRELEIGKNKSVESPYYSAVLYTVPTYSNPSGTILSHERRQKLVQLAHQHDMLVICDDVYDMLYQPSEGKSLPPLVSYDMAYSSEGNGNVISNGTFSKILSPGVRCGWVQARSGLIKRLAKRQGCSSISGLHASGGSPAHFVSKLILETLRTKDLQKHIAKTRDILSERMTDGLITPIDELLLPLGCSYHKPKGGYFLWLKLPQSITSQALEQTILKNRIKVSCGYGYHFAVPSKDHDTYKLEIGSHVRLCFAFYSTSDLKSAVERLHQAIKICLESQK